MVLAPRGRARSAMLAAGVVALTAALLTGAGPASDAAPAGRTAPARSCLTMKNMTEEIVDGSVRDLGGPYPRSVGGSSTYYDFLYDSSGRKTATVYGKANVPMKLADGDVAEYSDERIEFSDGVIETQGFYDITKAEKGGWTYLPLVGLEGRYRGMLGKRHFRITKLGKSLDGWIEMCPAGQEPK